MHHVCQSVITAFFVAARFSGPATHVLCAKDRSSVLGGVADWPQAGLGSNCAEGAWVSPVIGISQIEG